MLFILDFLTKGNQLGGERVERIWAPWRMGYILSEKSDVCFLCEKVREGEDKKNYILDRGRYSFVIMNIFPYNNGHLMIAPYKHTGNLQDLSDEELLELMKILNKWVKILTDSFHPQGFNIGINLGKVAGAGLEEHLHYHIVPRWDGDTNFMPVVAGTKIISDSLDSCYEYLKNQEERG